MHTTFKFDRLSALLKELFAQTREHTAGTRYTATEMELLPVIHG